MGHPALERLAMLFILVDLALVEQLAALAVVLAVRLAQTAME